MYEMLADIIGAQIVGNRLATCGRCGRLGNLSRTHVAPLMAHSHRYRSRCRHLALHAVQFFGRLVRARLGLVNCLFPQQTVSRQFPWEPPRLSATMPPSGPSSSVTRLSACERQKGAVEHAARHLILLTPISETYPCNLDIVVGAFSLSCSACQCAPTPQTTNNRVQDEKKR